MNSFLLKVRIVKGFRWAGPVCCMFRFTLPSEKVTRDVRAVCTRLPPATHSNSLWLLRKLWKSDVKASLSLIEIGDDVDGRG
jgi:hypothetical protein